MFRHDLVSAQTSNVSTTSHAALNAIACMCRKICGVTSSNVLGRLVQCKQKGWGRERVGWYTPKGDNSMAVCGFQKNPQ